MKRILFVGLGLCAFGSAFADWTFHRIDLDNAYATDLTPDGKYAAVQAGTNVYRWSEALGLEGIGGSISGGQAYISADGQRIAAESLDGAGKRHASYYDFGAGTWTVMPQPAGFSTTGSGSNLSTMWGMDDSGNYLATAVYNTGLKYRPVVYDIANGTYSYSSTMAEGTTTAHARPNNLSGDGLTMVGWDSSSSTRRAAVWRSGAEIYYDGDAPSEINATNFPQFGTTTSTSRPYPCPRASIAARSLQVPTTVLSWLVTLKLVQARGLDVRLFGSTAR